MGQTTNIQWTEASWNPIRGYSRVSAGCTHCYAETVAHRFSGPGQPYEGLIVVNQSTGEPRWNGTIKLVEEHLLDPLRWQKPKMIFVNSMSDLFHDGVPDEYIDKVFAVMALSPQHTFQVLTKRPERMKQYLTEHATGNGRWPETKEEHAFIYYALGAITDVSNQHAGKPNSFKRTSEAVDRIEHGGWPLPNVWLGVSVEDQQTADERIPILLQTPAAVRWISAEPLIGPVDLQWHFGGDWYCDHCADYISEQTVTNDERHDNCGREVAYYGPLSWAVVGGESGPKARPFNIEWARSIVRQCKEANVACFYKQGGSSNSCEHDRKGGHFECFPSDLQVREYA